MEKELSYLTPEGYTVFTSKYLKNKGTCCKSACLHCPYGYTLKKHGMEFTAPVEGDTDLIEEILSEASGTADWKSFLPENILLIKIKGTVCGFLLKNHIVVKNVFLRTHFQNQDLSKELIESYLFI